MKEEECLKRFRLDKGGKIMGFIWDAHELELS